MPDESPTTTMMLEGLFDPANAEVWSEFDRRFRPIILGFARHCGLSDADAADVAQETMTAFVVEYRAGHYDRDRGRLHSWLIGLAKYRVARLRRNRNGRCVTSGDSGLCDSADEHQMTRFVETERRREVLREALDQLRTKTRITEETMRAFELFVVRQLPAVVVARQLGVDTQDVYLAKQRVARRLREIVDTLEKK